MKKLTSLLLCMVLVLSMFCVNAAAAETACVEACGTITADGTVRVVVSAKQAAANARLSVVFDSDDLVYTGYETAFSVHSVKTDGEKVTVGLANASSDPAAAGEELVTLIFEKTGNWASTSVTVTAERYAGQQVDQTVAVEVTVSCRFQDVTPDKWYFEAVEYMAAEGYILGVSDTRFAPDAETSRAAFVTLLGRLEGVEKAFVQTRFSDVPVVCYYSGYVGWADENGIAKGVSSTRFSPDASVTREQMMVFLYRYVRSEGVDVTVADPEAALARFADGDSVSGWAKDAVAWAIDRGIINGIGNGKLAPQNPSTRAQAAVMLYRFFFED